MLALTIKITVTRGQGGQGRLEEEGGGDKAQDNLYVADLLECNHPLCS